MVNLSSLAAFSRRRNGKDRKHCLRQIAECCLLYLRSRLGPGFYFLARLDESDVPLRDVLGFASVRAYNAAVHRANDPSYHRASQHKAIEKAVLTTYGVPTPELIAFAHRDRGRSLDGEAVNSASDILALLEQEKSGEKYCLKQAHGWGGAGFRAIELRESESRIADMGSGELHDAHTYLESLLDSSPEGFVIERYLDQHPYYSGLNTSSVNSFRILIWDRPGAERSWLLAFLRVGREGALVDNATSGAIVFPVNPATKSLEAGFEKYGDGTRYPNHPDSGQQLAGIQPPDFDSAVELALTAVRTFPGISFAGVDVAMSVNGPRVLELNVWPDYGGFAYCRIPSIPNFTALV